MNLPMDSSVSLRTYLETLERIARERAVRRTTVTTRRPQLTRRSTEAYQKKQSTQPRSSSGFMTKFSEDIDRKIMEYQMEQMGRKEVEHQQKKQQKKKQRPT